MTDPNSTEIDMNSMNDSAPIPSSSKGIGISIEWVIVFILSILFFEQLRTPILFFVAPYIGGALMPWLSTLVAIIYYASIYFLANLFFQVSV